MAGSWRGHDRWRFHARICFCRYDRLWKKRDLIVHVRVDGNVFRRYWRSAQGVEYRRTLDGQRRLLVTRQFCNRRLVKSSSCVDICHVNHVVCLVRFCRRSMSFLVLASGCEEQTTIGSEGQAAEEGCEGLVGVHASAAGRHVQAAADAGRSRGHNGR